MGFGVAYRVVAEIGQNDLNAKISDSDETLTWLKFELDFDLT